MSDGPTDFESGYFFESQKGISDRRAARGPDQGPMRSTTHASDGAASSGGGGGSILGLLLSIIAIVSIAICAVAIFIAFKIAAFLIGLLIAAVFASGGRRRRRRR
jgi:hypothetical protein